MILGHLAAIKTTADDYIKEKHDRTGHSDVFTHLVDEQRVVCNACNAYRCPSLKITKNKRKAKSKSPTTNKMATVMDACNFRTQHCVSPAHKCALDCWGGKPTQPSPELQALYDRLKNSNDTSHHGSDGKDTKYAKAGTDTYKHLQLLNCYPHCRACDMYISIAHNGWARHTRFCMCNVV